MPPRTDAYDRPADDPPDAVSLAALIAARHRREIAVYRNLLVHTAADHRVDDRGNRWPAHARLVEGLSLLDPDVRIHLLHTHQDGGDLGSFPPGENVVALRIPVQVFPAQVPTRPAKRGQLVEAVSTARAEGALPGESETGFSWLRTQTKANSRRIPPPSSTGGRASQGAPMTIPSTPSSHDGPNHRAGKRALSELHIALPRWWPGRPNTEVVGGDLETGAVIVHLPYEGSPYLARLPLDGSLPGTTATTMAELQRGYMTYEWSDRSWRWILISRTSLTSPEIGAIRESMTGDAAAPSRRGQTSPPARGPVSDD